MNLKNIWKNYLKRREDKSFNDFIEISSKAKSRKFYNEYGKVLRVHPKKLFKKCLIIDTVIPLTFFIPVIFAAFVFVITLGKEFMVVVKE